MDDNDRARLIGKAHRVSSLSSNDLHELGRILSSGLQPFAGELQRIFDRAQKDDDAVLLKAALQGTDRLSSNERHRLDEATVKRGKSIPR